MVSHCCTYGEFSGFTLRLSDLSSVSSGKAGTTTGTLFALSSHPGLQAGSLRLISHIILNVEPGASAHYTAEGADV